MYVAVRIPFPLDGNDRDAHELERHGGPPRPSAASAPLRSSLVVHLSRLDGPRRFFQSPVSDDGSALIRRPLRGNAAAFRLVATCEGHASVVVPEAHADATIVLRPAVRRHVHVRPAA